jgi:ribosome biogenesis GTPase A
MERIWYAGHMARAKRIIREKLKLVDLVIEVADARIPLSSRSPAVISLQKRKPFILALNKADLADPLKTKQWVDWYRSSGVVAVPCDSLRGAGTKSVLEEAFWILPAENLGGSEKRSGRAAGPVGGAGSGGASFRPLRSIIVGVPNVGKSTLINCLAGRKAARTGKLPGLTRGEQWVRVGKKLDLLDTPGVLQPRLGDPETTWKLAAFGIIKEEFVDAEEVAGRVLKWFLENRPADIFERFGIKAGEAGEVESILDLIGQKRGFLEKGGNVDRLKASRHILKEFRAGRLGRLTLECPPDRE